MLRALDHWGADTTGSWTSAGAGLGHLLLKTTAQSRFEVLPAFDPEPGIAVTGDLRLDNRAELARQFGLDHADLATWSDGQLLLRAYREWGEAFPQHLLGDFAFAIWDSRRRTLFCARDVFGVKPFYYSPVHGGVAFASEIKGLLALPAVDARIDEAWIGDYLHRLTLGTVDTFYAGIKRLAPAHALLADARGIRTWRYYELDRHRELRLPRDEDYIDAFREKLILSIRRRIETPDAVGAELSGGLDSSGICAIAHRLLGETGRELQTFSQVRADGDAHSPGMPDDARWAIEALCRHTGIAHTHLLSGDGGIIPALEWAAVRYDEPPRNVVSLYNDTLYDTAAAGGVRVLLSGFAGNHGVSAIAEGRLRELLWTGAWAELWRELSARDTPLGAAQRLTRLIGGELDGPLLDAIVGRSKLWKLFPYRLTRDDFARRIRMRRRVLQSRRQYSRRGSLRRRAIRMLTIPEVPLRLEYANVSTAARRIEYRYPLLDVELVSLYLSIPSRLKFWRGRGRYLFRRSLEHWVPDDVRWADGPRASANPGSLTRRLRDWDSLLARLHALPPDNPLFRYVDPGKLLLQSPMRRQYARHRHTELLMALLLERKLRLQPLAALQDE